MKAELKDKRNKDTGTAIERYYKSFCHAVDGFVYVYKQEHNLKLIILAIILVVIAGFNFHLNQIEWIACIICFGTTAASEMINTSIEATIDLVTLEKNNLAKIAKDTASSATLIFSLMSLVIAIIIFLPKILERF